MFIAAVVPLAAQTGTSGDIYLPDLGIIIDAQPDTTNTVNLILQKQASSAAYIETTRELRKMLSQLGGQIAGLESSLDEDMAAVSLENNRLRSLIGKMQADREAERARHAGRTPPATASGPPAFNTGAASFRPRPAGLGDIMVAYVDGRYREVTDLCARIDDTVLTPAMVTQLAYWCADANFRLGLLENALLSLGGMRDEKHALNDDALILRGMIYLKLGRPAQARSQFEAIISQHPSSDYYRLAEMTLREIHEL